VTVTANDVAMTALQYMLQESIEHVPVINADDRLIGICTRTDLMRIREHQFDMERHQAGWRSIRKSRNKAKGVEHAE
jgi:CBS-domain-containing membrane protein